MIPEEYSNGSIGFDLGEDGAIETFAQTTDLDGDGVIDQSSLIQGIDTNGDGEADVWMVQLDADDDDVIENEAITEDFDHNELEITTGDRAEIVGDPSGDMEHWHQQTYEDTCAIASQEFILNELTGQDFSEDQLRQEAIDHGWYIAGGGTPLDCMGNLLEAHGIDVDRNYDCTLEDLSQKLAEGQRVMVAVDADEIWHPGMDDDEPLSNFVGMPGQDVNHAVQVIGIDYTDPDELIVILNDPGVPKGQGARVPADQFLDAWEDSNHLMVSTTGENIYFAQQDGAHHIQAIEDSQPHVGEAGSCFYCGGAGTVWFSGANQKCSHCGGSGIGPR